MAGTGVTMNPTLHVYRTDDYAREAASYLAGEMEDSRSVVITGGRTAAEIYPALADEPVDWSKTGVFFSDERCVPPHHEASNYRMACELLLDRVEPATIARMRGEDDPDVAASLYEESLEGMQGSFDVVLLGLGGDCHIAGLFPHGSGIERSKRSCIAVERPDGMRGLTLTPAPILKAKRIVVITTGDEKAEPVRRALRGVEAPEDCPARLLAGHPAVTFLIDEAAAALL